MLFELLRPTVKRILPLFILSRCCRQEILKHRIAPPKSNPMVAHLIAARICWRSILRNLEGALDTALPKRHGEDRQEVIKRKESNHRHSGKQPVATV